MTICERCWRQEEAQFQVYTDELDIAVCSVRAAEVRKLNLPVKSLFMSTRSLCCLFLPFACRYEPLEQTGPRRSGDGKS